MGELRVRKIQEFIKQEVSKMLLNELKDPRIGFVTVTDARITGDLRDATVYVSLFGSDEAKQETPDHDSQGSIRLHREVHRSAA